MEKQDRHNHRPLPQATLTRSNKLKYYKKVSVISVGYEGRTIDEILAILTEHGVEKLLDIREAPISRRRDFNKKSLGMRLSDAGIEYQHVRPAGNPHRKAKQDIERCLKLYKTHLEKNPEVLDLVAEELTNGTVAFLCYERSHNSCHRSVLLESLTQNGYHLEVVRVE